MTLRRSKTEERRYHSRLFPMVPVKDGGGRTLKGFRITCSDCGVEQEVLRSNMTADERFRREGWEVGKNEYYDLCPACVAKRDHKETTTMPANDDKAKTIPAAAYEPPPPMGREDRRLIWRAVEERWNEKTNRYQIGWSDQALATHLGVDLEWVVEVRQSDFGEYGDDPKIEAFLADQANLRSEMQGLTALLQMLQKDVGEVRVMADKIDGKFSGFSKHHNKLYDRVQALGEVAKTLEKK
jgi:hypothetical protein